MQVFVGEHRGSPRRRPRSWRAHRCPVPRAPRRRADGPRHGRSPGSSGLDFSSRSAGRSKDDAAREKLVERRSSGLDSGDVAQAWAVMRRPRRWGRGPCRRFGRIRRLALWHWTASRTSSMSWPADNSTTSTARAARYRLPVNASDGNGHRLIGRNRPARSPPSRARAIAVRATGAGDPVGDDHDLGVAEALAGPADLVRPDLTEFRLRVHRCVRSSASGCRSSERTTRGFATVGGRSAPMASRAAGGFAVVRHDRLHGLAKYAVGKQDHWRSVTLGDLKTDPPRVRLPPRSKPGPVPERNSRRGRGL